MEGTDISLYFQEDSVIRGTAYKWGEAKVNLGPSFGSDVGRGEDLNLGDGVN